VLEPRRGDRQHLDAALVDEERILVGTVGGAAVLDDAQAPGGDLPDDPVVEQDHAVGHVLLEPVAGERAIAPLGGDDRGHLPLLEPAEQPAQLGAQHRLVGQATEQGLDGVQGDALGADRVDGVTEADEQRLQIVVAGLLDLAALDVDVVHGQLPAADQVVQAEAQGADVLAQLLGGLLEGHEHARLAVADRAVYEELHRQQGLAATGTAADQSRPAPRQAAEGDLVETGDARRSLGQSANDGRPGPVDGGHPGHYPSACSILTQCHLVAKHEGAGGIEG
jgi:hypothetical protein